jgi:hypothetical protein
VLTAQASDAQTRSDLIAARRQLISDRVSLARALGGEWMEQEMRERFTAEIAENAEKRPVLLINKIKKIQGKND